MAAVLRKPILISGGGLSSLLLAQSLRLASIPFIVFERDSSISFRAQGYRLRLSSKGLDAIESVLSPEGFKKFWDTCGKTGGDGKQPGGLAILDALTAEKITPPPAKEEDADKPKPLTEVLTSRNGQVVGISRGDMRKLFLEGCEDSIEWSKNVRGYEVTSTGVHAIFADGSKSVEGELLVGGEGIYSKVAKQVSGGKIKVYDTGARGIHGQAPTTAFKALGEGVFIMQDHSNPKGKVFCITNVRAGDMDNPDLQFGWTMGAVPGVINPPNDDYSMVGKPAADLAKSFTEKWHPKFKSLFDEMIEADAAFWKITCSTPSGVPEWPNEPRVTVIGDAAHSMTPAGGIGANTGVQDSALLGKLLTEAGGWNEGITTAYEKEMRVYASEAVAYSYGMAKLQFGVTIDENTPTV